MSSQPDPSEGGQERENASSHAPLASLDAPQKAPCNEVCNASLREKIAAAVLAGDDAEAARLMTVLATPPAAVVPLDARRRTSR